MNLSDCLLENDTPARKIVLQLISLKLGKYETKHKRNCASIFYSDSQGHISHFGALCQAKSELEKLRAICENMIASKEAKFHSLLNIGQKLDKGR